MNKKITQPLPFIRLLPNIITLLALAIGMSAIRFAIEQRWELAVISVMIAVVLDGLDGRLARILNATSTFGAELDSLADFVNFGIAPALIIYLWSFQAFDFKLISWGVVVLYSICAAIRLARFNTTNIDEHDEEDIRFKYFFIGIPAPAGAMLALIPLMLDFELAKIANIHLQEYILSSIIYIAIIGFLMASRIPSFSLKYIRIKPEFIWFSLLFSSIFIILLLTYTWSVLPIIGLGYILTIPVSIVISRRIN